MKFLSNLFEKLFGAKKSAEFENVVVGKILEIEKHPNADRLQVTKIDIGGKILQIVCGASNIQVGQMVPVALVSAKLPASLAGGPNGMEIKEAEIRGVKSFGMLCAEDELGLGTDHSGIMILDSPPHQCGDGDRSKKQNSYWCGGKKAEIGMEFAKYIDLV